MNLNGEILTLSRHLMLFLVAVFAFASKSLLDSKDIWVQTAFAAALLLGLASFMAGYSTIFSVFNEEESHPKQDEAKQKRGEANQKRGETNQKLTPKVSNKIKLQYATTMLALLLAVLALIRLLIVSLPKAATP
jgi:hypothetical protein